MKIDKFLYEFKLNKIVEMEETETSLNEKGEEVKTIKKVKKDSPVHFKLIKPNRKLFDEAELFYGIKLSEGIKAGLLTKSLLAKRYQNDGGAMSEPEKEKYAILYLELYRLQNDLQRIQLNLDSLPKEEQDKKIEETLVNISQTKRDLQEIETYHSTLFDQTAENRARNQVILWWVLNLSYVSYDDKITFSPIFQGNSFESKLTAYDLIEEQDDVVLNAGIKKLAYFISLWYMGKASTQEEFKSLEEFFDS